MPPTALRRWCNDVVGRRAGKRSRACTALPRKSARAVSQLARHQSGTVTTLAGIALNLERYQPPPGRWPCCWTHERREWLPWPRLRALGADGAGGPSRASGRIGWSSCCPAARSSCRHPARLAVRPRRRGRSRPARRGCLLRMMRDDRGRRTTPRISAMTGNRESTRPTQSTGDRWRASSSPNGCAARRKSLHVAAGLAACASSTIPMLSPPSSPGLAIARRLQADRAR